MGYHRPLTPIGKVPHNITKVIDVRLSKPPIQMERTTPTPTREIFAMAVAVATITGQAVTDVAAEIQSAMPTNVELQTASR